MLLWILSIAIAVATGVQVTPERGDLHLAGVTSGVTHDAPPTATPVPATPTPVPTAVPALSSWPTERALTRGEVASLARAAGFPQWAVPAAVRVAWCESTWKPWATGAAGEYSLFQIHPVHIARFNGANPYSPLANARVAYQIWSEQGWGPWTCKP